MFGSEKKMRKGFVFTVDSILSIAVSLLLAGTILFIPQAEPKDLELDSIEKKVSDQAMLSFLKGETANEDLPENQAIAVCRNYLLYDLEKVKPSINSGTPSPNDLESFTHKKCGGINK